MDKKKPLQVYLTDGLRSLLEKSAKLNKRSLTKEIEYILDLKLSKKGNK